MNLLRQKATELWEIWQNFWFAPKDLFLVSLFRCLLGAILFVFYGIRQFDFETFFSNNGLLTYDQATEFLPIHMQGPFSFALAGDQINLILHGLLLLLLLLLTLGLLNRWNTFLVFVLHLVFLQRNPTILYGADLVTTFWLFYLSFIQHNRHFNLYRYLKKRKDESPGLSDPLSSMFMRFIQVQLCVIYAYTGMEKLKGETWWEGSATWFVMANENIVPYDLSFMASFPWAIAGMTFFTLIFEVYFPLAIWQKPLRKFWLMLGFCLHTMAALFMGLYFFSIIMLVSYLLFFEHKWLKNKWRFSEL